MKAAFPQFFGNSALRERLRDDICRQRFSHAYLLDGAYGYGKRTLALQIAAALSCEQRDTDGVPLPCGTCPSCRKILSGKSPDVILIGKDDKATVGVEAIRKMHTDVLIAPNDGDCKIYIIEDAHLLTVQAQNAFLLTLEEPPAYVVFLLLCETSAPMLETVKSRAPTLRLQPLGKEELTRRVCEISPEAAALQKTAPQELAELVTAAEGSLGRALDLSDAKRRKPMSEARGNVRTFLDLASQNRTGGTVLQFLNGLGQKREDLQEWLRLLSLALRDLLLCKQSENTPLCFFSSQEEAEELSCRFPSPALLQLYDCTSETSDRLKQNANVRLMMTRFAMKADLLPQIFS